MGHRVDLLLLPWASARGFLAAYFSVTVHSLPLCFAVADFVRLS